MSTNIQRGFIGLTILRIVVGIVFIAHGAQKLFVFGYAGVSGAFTHMGIPIPSVTGELVALLEFFGGIALVLGLLTAIIGALFAIEMLGAIFFVHAKNGFFAPMGVEFPLTLLASSIAIALAGPGALALDNLVATRRVAAARTT